MRIAPLVFLLILLPFAQYLLAQDTIIHYTETTGFDHNTRDQSLFLFQTIGTQQGFVVLSDDDGHLFNKADLSRARFIVFSNTSGANGLNSDQQAALEWFVDTLGRHLMGIHAASDTYRHSTANGGSTGQWDWYAETLGGSVQNQPNHTSQNHVDSIFLVNAHPSAENIDFPWIKEEEYYYWENGYLNTENTTILEVGETGSQSFDRRRPVAWFREKPSGGKIFYTSLGHKRSNFTGGFPFFKQLIMDASSWLLECPQRITELKDSICVGETYVFNGRPIREGGTYTDTLPSTSGCDSIVELDLFVDTLNIVVEIEEQVLGVSVEGTAYQWLDCDDDFSSIANATESIFEPSASGSFAVEITTAAGCTDTSECVSVIISSSDDAIQQANLRVFPNPAMDLIQLKSNGLSLNGKLEILNYQGVSVFKKELSSIDNEVLHIRLLPAGTYLLILQGPNFRWSRLFIKL
jgi:type 1 glutamine amidotransferase